MENITKEKEKQAKRATVTARIYSDTSETLKIIALRRKKPIQDIIEEYAQAGIATDPTITIKDGKIILDR